MRQILVLVGIVLALVGPMRGALGQAVTGEVISAGLGGSRTMHGDYRRGCWVPVRVRLENRAAAPQDVVLEVQQSDLDGDTISSLSQKVTLAGGGLEPRDAWVYYWPQPNDQSVGAASVQVLSYPGRRLITTLKIPSGRANPPGLGPTGNKGQGIRWVVRVGQRDLGLEQYRAAVGGNATTVVSTLAKATDLPDKALGLDGVDVILLEGESAQIGSMHAEFELQALLDWVRAGGHLIVTAGRTWPEVANRASKLSEALPMALPAEGASVRELPDGEIIKRFARVGGPQIEGPFVQAIGKLKPGARSLGPENPAAGRGGAEREPGRAAWDPLVVTGTYGAGVVTLVTVDLGAVELAKLVEPVGGFAPGANRTGLSAVQWQRFWAEAALWKGPVVTGKPAEDAKDAASAALDTSVAKSVDFASQAVVGVALAVLFLGLYWVVAGPGGHLVLRYYQRTHWSWWIFGATVVVASAAAVSVATFMRLEHYDLRHRTFVMGTVGENEASVVAYYGVYAPVDGRVRVELPETTGLSYLAPFNQPREEEVLTYPDPQSYELANGQPRALEAPFRNTLKQVQARWVGTWGGTVEGKGLKVVLRPQPGGGRDIELEGELTNRTGYDLKDVRIAALSDAGEAYRTGRLFDVGDWKDGATLALGPRTARRLDHYEKNERTGAEERLFNDNLEELLAATGRSLTSEGALGAHVTGALGASVEVKTDPIFTRYLDHREDLLGVLLDWRMQTHPGMTIRRAEFSRHLTRLADRSLGLRAGKMVIMARAGDAGSVTPTPAPVRLKVNGQDLRGTGEILFSWVAHAADER